MLGQQVQTALRVLFPPSCAGCGGMVDSPFGLCGACWRDLPLISGPVCDSCGVPVMVADPEDLVQCDDCQRLARPWYRGRAAMRYRGMGRKLVLGLKHGDRQDVAVTASTWLARTAQPLLQADTVLVPIPLHWSRLVKRRYNQSALLVQRLAPKLECGAALDALVRPRRTQPLERVSVDERFARLTGAISVHPGRARKIAGRHVILVDDVMTSGATLASGTEACLAAGARQVDVLVLARVCKDD